MAVAITAELVALGVKPMKAGHFAFAWTDLGIRMEDGAELEKITPRSFLAVFPGEETFVMSTSEELTLGELLRVDRPSPATSVAIVHWDPIFRRVIDRLRARGARGIAKHDSHSTEEMLSGR